MSKPSSTLRLIAGEPYRIFFPIALLVGVIGVVLWPLFYWGKLDYYPAFAHSRLMIEGFVGGFAIGFLGTALPRMLSSKPFRVWQVGLLLVLYGTCCGFHAAGYIRAGDGLFAAVILVMVAMVLARVIKGNTVPPPGIAMAGLGMLCAVFGAGWLSAFGLTGSLGWTVFFQRLLNQAFILLPLLGIGGFIFPMILGTKNQHAMLVGPKVSKAWKRKVAEGGLLGGLLILTYWIEAQMLSHGNNGSTRLMSAVRFALCAVWISKESGWLQRHKARGIMPFALRAGIICLLGGLVLTAIFRGKHIALEHTLYIGGFGLITMIVATRVIYGHSGQGSKFQKWLKPLIWCTALLLLGTMLRVTADFIPKVMTNHHIYAAVCWVVVSIIWAVAVLPSVRKRPVPVMPFVKPNASKPSVLNMDFRKK